MTIFGYARVSTTHQKFDSQLDALSSYGVDYIYKEQESGTKQNRPVLKKLLLQLKSGDTLVIFKLDRLARGTRELLHLIELFEKKISISLAFKIISTLERPLANYYLPLWGLLLKWKAT